MTQLRTGLAGTVEAAFEIMRYASVPNSFRSVSEFSGSMVIR